MKRINLFVIAIYLTLGMQAQEIKVGDNMPEFELKSMIYGDVSTTDLKGKVVLISLFATWCPPCQLELADIQSQLWPKYKDNKNFALLVIGREHTDQQLKEYNDKKKFEFPLYPDPKREVFSKFASKSIPRAYLINKEGKVVHASLGYSKEEFKELLENIEEELNKKK